MDFIKKIIYKTLRVGVLATDSEALQLKKISITMVPVIIAPVGFIWSLIYFFLGYTIPATIPMLYTVSSIITVYIFSQTKSITFIHIAQMFLILLLPFALMWSLGGFYQSSYIFIWAFFAPIIALIHDKGSKSLYWLYAFIILIIFSVAIDSWLIENIHIKISQIATEIFFILNISIALGGIYFLIRYFIDENDKNADELLHNNISYLNSYKESIDNNLIVTRTDINGSITFANSNFYKLTGYSPQDVIGKTHNIVRHPDSKDTLFQNLWNTILRKKTWHGTVKNRKKDGSSYWVDTTVSPILNQHNTIVEFIAIRHDISKLIQHQDELENLLYTDTLTNLRNRNALLKDIKTDESLSAILINIDHFSHINNLYGEIFGNKVLVKFSDFLYKYIQKNSDAKLYRLSGDEFIITSPTLEKEIICESARNLLLECSQSIIMIDEQSISLNVTIAVSLEENTQLISTLNMAVIAARKEFKSIMLYTESLSLNDEYQNNIKWIKEIKDAIAEDRITMFYQPIVDNNDLTHMKYETLIRLIDKQGNVITPFYFLEIAKKAKLYKQLTKIVIRKSFEAFKDNDYEFSINITIDDILDKEITDFIVETLQTYNISQRVIFEIVESESIENFDEIERFIVMIKKFGCRISIDDFGTGYSNFEHLMRLQADYIKIDGSIIKEITTDKRSALITSVIVAFAKEMNIKTIGEYVETKEINDKLIDLGVDKSQGYYFDKPQAELKYYDKKSP